MQTSGSVQNMLIGPRRFQSSRRCQIRRPLPATHCLGRIEGATAYVKKERLVNVPCAWPIIIHAMQAIFDRPVDSRLVAYGQLKI